MFDFKTLEKVRERGPLVHNITNIVVANDSANGLLAIGASPIMASAKEEMAELGKMADVLVINIGTLDDELVEAMKIAGRAANSAGTPVVLDPVGVGATSYRRHIVSELLAEIQFTAIRGNAGELATIAGEVWEAKGVDAGVGSIDTLTIAEKVATTWNTTVVISRAVDVISDGKRYAKVANGSELLPRITGSGCLLSAICGSFIAVEKDVFQACVEACASYAVASEYAEMELPSKLPGSFRPLFIDALASWSVSKIQAKVKIQESGERK
ncbi:hydroxyethylthiazole kinase [Listeria ivanovii]|uniref:hydroxyethylthiazole kinase n=1 Tax=Listeria ivanovii TaxID=1638 RepID=UPI000DAA4F71|nr:hydroxyethylthiazole kinase [Listeria ivanovii]PZG45840.1 hydroxyethylthiazole kinase [Listeria ivanovii]